MNAFVLSLILSSGLSSFCLSQTRFGYVDFNKVADGFSEYQTGLDELRALEKLYLDSLTAMYHTFNSRLSSPCNGGISTPRDSLSLALLNGLLDTERKEIEEVQQKMNDVLTEMNDRFSQTISKVVSSKLEQFCLEENVQCVLWKEHIWYCEDCRDFTDDFIAFLSK